jgi:hypothetical protein
MEQETNDRFDPSHYQPIDVDETLVTEPGRKTGKSLSSNHRLSL